MHKRRLLSFQMLQLYFNRKVIADTDRTDPMGKQSSVMLPIQAKWSRHILCGPLIYMELICSHTQAGKQTHFIGVT